MARDGLKAEMLAVPEERPSRLEAIQEIEIRHITAVRGTYGQLHAMHHNGEGSTCLLGASKLVGQKFQSAAAAFAARRGALIVEGYPTEPYEAAQPDAFLWTGTPSAFRKAGFVEAARRSASRPIMRRSCA